MSEAPLTRSRAQSYLDRGGSVVDSFGDLWRKVDGAYRYWHREVYAWSRSGFRSLPMTYGPYRFSDEARDHLGRCTTILAHAETHYEHGSKALGFNLLVEARRSIDELQAGHTKDFLAQQLERIRVYYGAGELPEHVVDLRDNT